MNLQNFGRTLVEVLAERSLEVIRGTNMDDVRRMMGGHLPTSMAPQSSSSHIGATLGAFAVGAAIGVGLTALYTPTSGDQLRKKLSLGAKDARKQALQLGDTVRHQLDDARTSIVHGVEQVSTAVGIASPVTSSGSTRRKPKSNGHAPTRSKKTATQRAHHA